MHNSTIKREDQGVNQNTSRELGGQEGQDGPI